MLSLFRLLNNYPDFSKVFSSQPLPWEQLSAQHFWKNRLRISESKYELRSLTSCFFVCVCVCVCFPSESGLAGPSMQSFHLELSSLWVGQDGVFDGGTCSLQRMSQLTLNEWQQWPPFYAYSFWPPHSWQVTHVVLVGQCLGTLQIQIRMWAAVPVTHSWLFLVMKAGTLQTWDWWAKWRDHSVWYIDISPRLAEPYAVLNWVLP